MSEKYTFADFLASVDGENQQFVSDLHDELTELGCKAAIKLASNGFVVSYSLNKKTIANYVFRKKGLIVRIYAGHIAQYEDVLDTLPDEMARAVLDAPVCKRMVDPTACNSKCAMGYDFIFKGRTPTAVPLQCVHVFCWTKKAGPLSDRYCCMRSKRPFRRQTRADRRDKKA